jgi:regulator of RNase E activity RraB
MTVEQENMTAEELFQEIYSTYKDSVNDGALPRAIYEMKADLVKSEWLPELEKAFKRIGLKLKYSIKDSEPVPHTSGSLLYAFELER